jgi:serine/threonine protein kinase
VSALPDRLGRYEIVGSLAHGGMAELFLARLPGVEGFAKRVVIKRVLPGLARDREFVDMFLAEARLAAALDHANIVHVHDIGHDAGGYFFAMELLHGADVGSLLRVATERDGELPLGIALEIVRGACAGLHYAHERIGATGAPLNLVHRDVSPQNIFVTFDGTAVLLDFGIAKAVEKIANHYTRSGTLRGKLPYMSPEQARAEPLDRRSDVFSLAIVLWEMTVGARLFGANNEGDFTVLKQIVETDAPRPSTRRAGYPLDLEEIVMTGLARDPAARFQTADALGAAIEGVVKMRGLWTTPRDVAAYMTALFPDGAAAWKRNDAEDRGGQVVPLRARHTVELPPEREPARGETMPSVSSPPPVQPPRPEIHRPRPSPPPAQPSASQATPSGRGLLVLIAALLVLAAVGTGYLVGRRRDTPASVPPASAATTPTAAPATPSTTAAPATPPALDAQFFEPGDYLISERAYNGARLDDVWYAKQLAAPAHAGAPTDFVTGTGRDVTTAYYWRTRTAVPADLAIGALVFCRATPTVHPLGETPREKQESRTRPWTLGRVTDLADVAAGRVTIADVPCELGALRVPLAP